MQEGKLRNDPSLIETGCQILDWVGKRDGIKSLEDSVLR